MRETPTSARPGSINFQLHALGSSLFKGATRYYVARFGVGLPEMRVLSNLGREGSLATHQLVALTAMDKALVSRVVAMLARRSYITATAPDADPRRRVWELTQSGKNLVARLEPVWRAREAIIQAELTPKEQVHLKDMLRRMFEASERLREQEAAELSASRRSLGTRAPAKAAPKAPGKVSARARKEQSELVG